MNLTELSKKSGIKYHTARKYVKALQEKGIISEVSEELIPILKQIAELTASGKTVNEAIDFLVSRPAKESNFSEILLRLESKIDALEKENRAQKELLQVYLSKIDKLQEQVRALPAPKKPVSERVKEWWKSLSKKLKGSKESP